MSKHKPMPVTITTTDRYGEPVTITLSERERQVVSDALCVGGCTEYYKGDHHRATDACKAARHDLNGLFLSAIQNTIKWGDTPLHRLDGVSEVK